MKNSSLMRRFASIFYEFIIVATIWFVSSGIYFGIYDYLHLPVLQQGKSQLVTQHPIEVNIGAYIVFWCILGIYFIFCWANKGSTLPQKTWAIKIVDFQGFKLSIRQAFVRYLLITLPLIIGLIISIQYKYLFIPLLFLNYIWAFFDRDQQFLHDRFANTRIIDVEKAKK